MNELDKEREKKTRATRYILAVKPQFENGNLSIVGFAAFAAGFGSEQFAGESGAMLQNVTMDYDACLRAAAHHSAGSQGLKTAAVYIVFTLEHGQGQKNTRTLKVPERPMSDAFDAAVKKLWNVNDLWRSEDAGRRAKLMADVLTLQQAGVFEAELRRSQVVLAACRALLT